MLTSRRHTSRERTSNKRGFVKPSSIKRNSIVTVTKSRGQTYEGQLSSPMSSWDRQSEMRRQLYRMAIRCPKLGNGGDENEQAGAELPRSRGRVASTPQPLLPL